MSERIDIANIALAMLGAEQITSFEDDLIEARQMQIHYDVARDATLEAFEWTFATIRFIPAKETEPPLYGWGVQFPIPSNILRVLRVERNLSEPIDPSRVKGHDEIDYSIERGKILCDQDIIYCTGIERLNEEGRFSNLFVHAFAAKLAMLCCYPITRSNEIFKAVAAMYAGSIEEAASRDGQQGRHERIRNKTLKRVR
jgi:hypothetical protein